MICFSGVLSVVAVFLTAAILTACAKKGDEDLRKGKAAYEAKDYETAVRHFTLAAKAQYKLGSYFESEEGVEQDKAEATKWYRMAAAQGYDPAVRKLEDLGKE